MRISLFTGAMTSYVASKPTQLPRSVSMLIKSFQVLYYDFLVVPSLDFMLEDKSSQKLMVPGVPFIENVDISVQKTGFCHFYNHFMWLP